MKANFLNKKEIHIFLDFIHNYKSDVLEYGHYVGMRYSMAETQRDINRGHNIIFTYQTSACSTENLIKGYRIFVYMLDGQKVEIKLGVDNACAKEIRVNHNIEKMLLGNMFGVASLQKEG